MKYLTALVVASVLALGVTGAEAKPIHGNSCVREIIEVAQSHGIPPGLKLRFQCGGR